MKKRAGHFQYNWWKYVAVLLIPLVIWCSVFSTLKKPKANERLHILFLGDGLNIQELEQELTAYLQISTTQTLKSVQVSVAEYGEENYASQLLAATYSYDIIIIGEKQMTSTVGQDYFFVLPQELRVADLYEETADGEVLPFGTVIFDGEQKNSFGRFYSGEEKCYAFISPQTANLYPLNTKSGEGDNATVLAYRWLTV